MYKIVQGTTPTHTFSLPVGSANCKAIQIIYKQDGRKLIKLYHGNKLPSGMTLDEDHVYVKLTQQETLSFRTDSMAQVQMRVLTDENNVIPSNKEKIKIVDSLDGEILT